MNDNRKREPIRISVDEAKTRYDESDVTILDVVDPGTYEELAYQIKGAIRIDPRDIPDEFERLPQDRAVLAY